MQPNDRISPHAGDGVLPHANFASVRLSLKRRAVRPKFFKAGMFIVERAAKSLENVAAARFEFVTHQRVALDRIVAAGDECLSARPRRRSSGRECAPEIWRALRRRRSACERLPLQVQGEVDRPDQPRRSPETRAGQQFSALLPAPSISDHATWGRLRVYARNYESPSHV